MDVSAVMEGLAEVAFGGIETLQGRTYSYPAPGIVPPAAFVGWPDQINYDLGMARGGWTLNIPLLVAVGRADLRSARDAVGAYLAGSGPSSVRAALSGGPYGAFDTALVTAARIEPVSVAGTEYLAAIFDVAVTGRN